MSGHPGRTARSDRAVRRVRSTSWPSDGPHQRLAQLYQGGPNPRLDGAERLLEARRDFDVCQALEIRQLNRDTLEKWQALERRADETDLLRREILPLHRRTRVGDPDRSILTILLFR